MGTKDREDEDASLDRGHPGNSLLGILRNGKGKLGGKAISGYSNLSIEKNSDPTKFSWGVEV